MRTHYFICLWRLFGYFACPVSPNHVRTQHLSPFGSAFYTQFPSVGTLFTVSPIATELRLLFQCGGSKPTTDFIHMSCTRGAGCTRSKRKINMVGGVLVIVLLLAARQVSSTSVYACRGSNYWPLTTNITTITVV